MSREINSVRLEIKNRGVKESFEQILSSVEGFRLQEPSEDPWACDVWVLEIGDDLEKEFGVIQDIHSSDGRREVFLTSSRLEPDLLIQALRAGAKEFFSQPIKQEEVKSALVKFKERRRRTDPSLEKKRRGKVINVMGSKGGVGTTTLAVNLATSLAAAGESTRVALIDMNLLFGEIPIFLDLESAFNWGEVAANISRLDATYLTSVLARHTSGVYVLPSPSGLDGAGMATPEILEKLLMEMQALFDFVVIDSGQSIDDVTLKILEISSAVLVVAILSLPSLTNAKRLAWTFQKLGYPLPENTHIVINRYHKKSEISLKEAEQSMNKQIFSVIPNDYYTTMSAINRGKPLASVAAGSEISKSFKALADKFGEKNEAQAAGSGIIEKLLRINR